MMHKFSIFDNVIYGYSEEQNDLYAQRIESGHSPISEKEVEDFSKSSQISVIQYVTRAQGKAALIRAGLWQGVVDFVNSISDPVEKAVAEVALNDTTHWQRSSPFLNAAAKAIGLTDKQLDQLFIDASEINL